MNKESLYWKIKSSMFDPSVNVDTIKPSTTFYEIARLFELVETDKPHWIHETELWTEVWNQVKESEMIEEMDRLKSESFGKQFEEDQAELRR